MNHLKNKRICSVAVLLQDQFGLALVRFENAVRVTICGAIRHKLILTPQNLVTSTSFTTTCESFFCPAPFISSFGVRRKWPRGFCFGFGLSKSFLLFGCMKLEMGLVLFFIIFLFIIERDILGGRNQTLMTSSSQARGLLEEGRSDIFFLHRLLQSGCSGSPSS
ncbi:DNA-directed RNA polymerase subunit beta [Platanthera zijinensis]|uniref:DNA-directed RNA polymerase subunit beta n=1 Tax=Platanthera zijinensis TaxID=2320716 RepID=A0AAP0FYU8_9ASPA